LCVSAARSIHRQIPGSRRRPSIISEVTEIPEHLLKRSRERRSAIGQGGDAAADAPADAAGANAPATTPATTTPAVAPAASGPPARTPAPAPAAPPPPKPEPVYVQAAKQRRKIPFWAMATLSLMPLWGFMYVRAVTEPAEVVEGPLGVGAEIYSSCASCHGAGGGGGVGYAFSGGTVLETFPHIEDQIRYVHYGTEGYNAAGIDIYGNPDREGGPHLTGGLGVMPAFGGQLTQYEIVSVVCHERYSLGGADPTSEEWADEYETWCSEESPVFAELQAGTYDYTSPDAPVMGEAEIMPVGPEAIAGSPASAG
jgi:mono/diheme cytochrome c family protein